MKILFNIALLLILTACAPTTTLDTQRPDTDTASQHFKMLYEGYDEIANGNPSGAIEDYFDPIIDDFEITFSDPDQRVYSARAPTETLLYLLKAAADEESAIVVSPVWAEAHYLKGYASLDLGRVEEAEFWVRKALELSPSNAVYLSEIGHIHKLNKRWSEALRSYEQAEESAQTYSPDGTREYELLVAMRGIGFSLVELGRLDEAEAKFHECLEIDENDQQSKNELAYIEGLRKNDASGSADP